LGKAQHGLPEEALADGILGEDLLDSAHSVVGVDVAVAVKLLLCDWR
jgi:hypothetical protein